MNIYTKSGDGGETRRIDGRCVRKSDPLVEALGTLDELNSHVGLCLAEAMRSAKDSSACDGREAIAPRLETIQRQLFCLGATLGGVAAGDQASITAETLGEMETWIDAVSRSLPPLHRFLLPDGGELSARLHVARTVARRAEREIVRYADTGGAVPPAALAYINRLSDLLFVAARLAGAKLGRKEQEW